MSSHDDQHDTSDDARAAAEQRVTTDTARGRRLMIIGGAVTGALALVIVAVLISMGGADEKPVAEVPAAESAATTLNDIPQDGVTLGDPDAPVTMVEFADLKCPYCKQAAENILPVMIDEYVRPGKLKIEFRNVSILDSMTAAPDSTNAATMGAALTLQNKLWNYIELFYANQKDEHETYATDEFLRELAGQIDGADVEQAMQDRANPKARNLLTEAEEKFNKFGSGGTPSFLVGKSDGKLKALSISTLTDPTDFRNAVDEALR